MRIIAVLIASALINASTIPGFAAESTLDKDVDAARAVSATVQSKSDNAADNGETCRAYAASFYKSEMLRQAAVGRIDGARMFIALDSVINAFRDLLATKCGS
ncbi:hypothetical protein [Bradyrhizobium liaoningense]|uniref:hypothetical protein n=1 Tax=Bradyrhizobium liaoningense TaxID=43992 RepID=UPI001BA8BC89|nr:hypothetical protein [Bradyrhizobium liaoningense]MBR0716500.1 hypothetical protein [Bradyrhizobium liaoningense]